VSSPATSSHLGPNIIIMNKPIRNKYPLYEITNDAFWHLCLFSGVATCVTFHWLGKKDKSRWEHWNLSACQKPDSSFSTVFPHRCVAFRSYTATFDVTFKKWRWGEYLDLRSRKWREAGEDCIMRSFVTCTHQILCDKIKGMRWAGHVARMGNMRNAYKMLVGKPERKTPEGLGK